MIINTKSCVKKKLSLTQRKHSIYKDLYSDTLIDILLFYLFDDLFG